MKNNWYGDQENRCADVSTFRLGSVAIPVGLAYRLSRGDLLAESVYAATSDCIRRLSFPRNARTAPSSRSTAFQTL
jgi:hypothetical protein